MTGRRTWQFAAVAVLLTGVAYLVASVQSGSPRRGRSALVLGSVVMRPPFLVFRNLSSDDAHGRVAMLSLRPGELTRHVSPLSCARVHYARGTGLCLVQEQVQGQSAFTAYTFDQTLTRRNRIVLRGVPTRARVSPDGRRATITTFAEEESPEGERLATDSMIIDVRSGRVIASLRDFQVIHDQQPPITGVIDIGSVAFEDDGDRFFATLSTETERYLVAGSVQERRVTAIRPGIANEALSPDGNHLAVKRLIGDRGFWQLGVIDLRTWTERDLNQGPRSIDDQVEWLDNNHVMYHDTAQDTTALWMLPIDGVSGPSIFVRDAFSGTTQR